MIPCLRPYAHTTHTLRRRYADATQTLRGCHPPPGDGGDRPLSLVKNDLVMTQPALLVQQKLACRAARNEGLLLPAHAASA